MKRAILASILLIAAGPNVLADETPSQYRTFGVGVPNFIMPSDAGRRELWSMSLKHLSWTGSGPATFYRTFKAHWKPDPKFAEQNSVFQQAHSHNAILEALSTRGVFGLLGLLALLALPDLAGLWTVCMFNPISFEVTFVACVLAGISRRLGEPNEA